MQEEWKEIKGYEGLYSISNKGRVICWNYKGLGYPRDITPHCSGYQRVGLVKNGVRKTYLVHRLVAIAFIPNPNNLPIVNHKDESKDNSFVGTAENNYEDGNLEWCTVKYNINYGTRIERQKQTLKANVNARGGRPYKIEDIYVYDYTTKAFIKKFSSLTEAAKELDCDRSTAYKVAQGQRRQTHNYIFSYVPLEIAE